MDPSSTIIVTWILANALHSPSASKVVLGDADLAAFAFESTRAICKRKYKMIDHDELAHGLPMIAMSVIYFKDRSLKMGWKVKDEN